MNNETSPRLNRVLVTNDDGIDAPGLVIAEDIASGIAREVWTVAPLTDYSGGSRQINLHRPLRLQTHGERRFSLDGSPADCVFVGLGAVLTGIRPDLVIAGVNAGVNIGGDVGFSGTVGAAMTAKSLGIPAIALSQAWKGLRDDIPWQASRVWLPWIVTRLLDSACWPWEFVPNVNVPAAEPDRITGFEVTRQGHSAVLVPTVEGRVDLRGFDYYWIYMQKVNDKPEPDEDIAALRRDAISVTPLGQDITDAAGIAALAESAANTRRQSR